MPASILVCDRSCLERLFVEGGLRRSFVHTVDPELSATIDTVAGDGEGLDDALDGGGLVCVDHKLVECALKAARVIPAGQGEVSPARNFVPKLASVPSIWLELITAGGGDQLSAIRESERRIADLFSEVKPKHCSLVLVLTQRLDKDSRREIARMGRGEDGPISRVYLMEDGLQMAAGGRQFVQADGVWPLYVARLLVALAPVPADHDSRQRKGVFAWRGFHVGTLDEASVESQFRKQLREELLPARQDAVNPSSTSDPLTRQHEAGQLATGVQMIGPTWSDHATALDQAFEEALRDDWFCTQLKRQGEARKSSGSEGISSNPVDENQKRVGAEWAEVAKQEGGPAELRRMAEGEMRAGWFTGSVSKLHESQRKEWSELIKARLRLRQRRDALRAAASELVEARKHHLPFSWRLYIALALLMGMAQFYAALLEPLRQATGSQISAQRSTLFGEPVEGSRVGFLIDRSVAVGRDQFEHTKERLANAVQALDASREFSLGAYSDDVTLMPECARGPVRAIESNKAKALAWIENLKLQGEPDPSRAVEAIVRFGLDRIALVSSGTVVEGGVQRLKQLVERVGPTLPPIDTITLPSVEEVPWLRELAGATKGRYRRVAFDPFAPIGFWATLVILVGLAGLGAALGVMIPWLLERRAGDRETSRLKRSCEGLRSDFVARGSETGRLFSNAADVCARSSRNAIGAQQQQLAKRALAALEQTLDGSSPLELNAPDHDGDRLRLEDRSDVKRVLDVPVPDEYLLSTEDRNKKVLECARNAANSVSKQWMDICTEVDRHSRGHLPVPDIMRLSEEIDRQVDALRSELVKPVSNGRSLEAELESELLRKLTIPAGYPLLSVPVESESGTTPIGHLLHVRLSVARGGNRTSMADRLPKLGSYGHFLETEPFGLVGYGLLVEQIEIHLLTESSWGVK